MKVSSAVLSTALFCCGGKAASAIPDPEAKLEGSTQSNVKEGVLPVDYPTIPVPPVDWSGPIPHNVLQQFQQQSDLELKRPPAEQAKTTLPGLQHSPSGNFPNLVLLLRFSDHVDRELPSQADISHIYNSEDVEIDDHESIKANDASVTPTGSVRQVYFENSHSTLTIETTVIDWITLAHTESYYASGDHGLSKSKFKEGIMEALTFLDEGGHAGDFDFANFDLDENGDIDGFGVLTSGYGAEVAGTDCVTGAKNIDRIWSHKSGMDWTSGGGGDGAVAVKKYYVASSLRGKCKSNIVRIGLLCHELGHYLGLPDFYDPTFKGNGLGGYDFMALSWGLDGSGLFPPNLSAFSKLQLGWVTAEVIDTDGTYELEASEYSTKVYKITSGFKDGEYLLMENRQPIGYDSKLPQGGIAIYHVDESTRGQRNAGFPGQDNWPENGNHYKVALLPADGHYYLEEKKDQGDEGDLWHAGSALKELGPGQDDVRIGGSVYKSSLYKTYRKGKPQDNKMNKRNDETKAPSPSPTMKTTLPRFPNTDSYQKGVVEPTGIRIYDFSESGRHMTVKVEFQSPSKSVSSLAQE